MQSVIPTLALTLTLAGAACGEARVKADGGPPPTRTERPAHCDELGPSDALQTALDAPQTAAVCLRPGRYAGPLQLRRAVTLWGPSAAVVHAERAGSTIELSAPGATLLGITIDGRGGRFDQADAAVHVTASETRVEGVTVIHAVFGILVDQAAHVQITRNHIHGGRDAGVGLRGDTIRLWETRDSSVSDNVTEDGRDIAVWYSSGNRISGNRVLRGRYGFHLMYSHDNHIIGNQLLDGVVGVFVMYSRGVTIEDNLIANAAGAAGMAIGLKESGNLVVRGNRLLHDTTGIYIDASPLNLGDTVLVTHNQLRLNDRALVFHSSGHRVRVTDNDFADNMTQIEIDGGGDALDMAWRGNYFDDYAGYDLDDDQVGDVPYEARSLSSELTSSHPGLALFSGTPALALVDAAAHLDPMYVPKPLLSDPAPRMSPVWSTDTEARP